MNRTALLTFMFVAALTGPVLAESTKAPVPAAQTPAAPAAVVPATPKMTVDEVAAKVQANYKKTKSIQARFQQETLVPGSHRVRKADGMVYFKLPGKMNWDYEKPQKLQYVSNGHAFTYYNADEKYLAIKKLEEAFDSPTPTNFLKGLGELKESFNIKEPDLGLIDGEGNYRIYLEAKDAKLGNFVMTLIVDPKNFKLQGLYQSDAQGSKTTIKFSDIKENEDIPDSLFVLAPPEGTKIQKF